MYARINVYRFSRCSGEAKVLRKLFCVGLSMADDPYLSSNDEKYVNDMTTGPSIEYGHIFGYFVTRPGVYTQQELLS